MWDMRDILGQAVNVIGDFFQTKGSCDLRSQWGQKYIFLNNLRTKRRFDVGVAPL